MTKYDVITEKEVANLPETIGQKSGRVGKELVMHAKNEFGKNIGVRITNNRYVSFDEHEALTDAERAALRGLAKTKLA